MHAVLYCTKSKTKLFYNTKKKKWQCSNSAQLDENVCMNGKVVARCEIETKELFCCIKTKHYVFLRCFTDNWEEFLKKSCISLSEIDRYNPKYAIYITNLEFFEKPRLLKNFYKGKLGSDNSLIGVTKAPQNMMYVYTSFDLPEIVETEFVLISIRPQWLCKILNHEKTIELRRKVLKEMTKQN